MPPSYARLLTAPQSWCRLATLLLGSTALAGAAIFPSVAVAASTAWTGAASSDWFDANNWDNGVPDNASPVSIVSNVPKPTVIDNGNAFAGNLVMYLGTSALTIRNAGTLSAASIGVGGDAGANASLTVDGASGVVVSGMLNVGVTGTGMLLISGASTVTNANSILGASPGASGTVTVTGTGSKWSSLALSVGKSGDGALTIAAGGAVTSKNGINEGAVGELVGGTGEVTVTGTGSTWSNVGFLDIGKAGTGTLTVAAGGTVHNTLGTYIGYAATGIGSVTVTGAGSTLIDDNGIVVGELGQASLNILAGGVVNTAFSFIASGGFHPHGEVVVDGAGSAWNLTSDLVVGDTGLGTLTISNGGKVTDGDAIIGENPVGVGVATVTGTGSTWTSATTLDVGYAATGTGATKGGTLNVLNGGSVSAADMNVATNLNSTGQLLIDGAGSKLVASHDATVGYRGSGLLTISADGQLKDVTGYIGRTASSTGTVLVTGGASWVNTDELEIGYSGKGTLVVEAGASVTDDAAYIGRLVGSTGSVTVDGAGSSWTTTGLLQVGTFGTGSLTITNGGHVTSAAGLVGGTVSSIGSVLITGAGSTWDLTGTSLMVGDFGTGDLSIRNGGTVNINSIFVGSGGGSTGTVTIDGAGSVLNNSNIIRVGSFGTGKLVLSNGGTLASSQVIVGDDASSAGTVVIGADLLAAAAAPGRIVPHAGDALTTFSFGAGTNGLLALNHTSDNYVFDAMVEGSGTIYQKAGTTHLTTDSTGYSGNIRVAGGTLTVDANYAGANGYASFGGTIGGSGTLQTLFVNIYGTVAPGNSIGTLHVANFVQFDSGSTYEVEVDAKGHSDLITTTGKAVLGGGTVQVRAGSGNYQLSTDYIILHADGGVTGSFAGVTSNAAFLTSQLLNTGLDVHLKLTRNAAAFGSVGQTANQVATGTALDALGFGNAAWNAVVQLDAASARGAFDQLSGEIHASLRSGLFNDSHLVRDAAIDRLRDAFGDVGAPGGRVFTAGSTGLTPADAAAPFAIWGHGFGTWGRSDGDGNAAAYRQDTQGMVFGVDALFAESFRGGFLGGYSHTGFKAADRASSGTSDNFHLGLFAGTAWGPLGLRAGATYTWHHIDTNRSVLFAGFADSLSAGYDAGTAQAFGDIGYRIDLAPGASLEPFGGIAYVDLRSDGFVEKGGGAALAVASSDTAATFTTLGLRGAVAFEIGGAPVSARGSLGWRHAFGDVAPLASLSFAGGDAFDVAGVPIAVDAAVIDAGVDVALGREVKFGLTYAGQIAADAQEHGFKSDLSWKF